MLAIDQGGQCRVEKQHWAPPGLALWLQNHMRRRLIPRMKGTGYASDLGDPEEQCPHEPRTALSGEPATRRQLALGMRRQTVARHQNDKVSVSPNLISKSGKKQRSLIQPAVSWRCLALQVSLNSSNPSPGAVEMLANEKGSEYVLGSC